MPEAVIQKKKKKKKKSDGASGPRAICTLYRIHGIHGIHRIALLFSINYLLQSTQRVDIFVIFMRIKIPFESIYSGGTAGSIEPMDIFTFTARWS